VSSLLDYRTNQAEEAATGLETVTQLKHWALTTPNGHKVGVSVGGHGIPLVFIHGFGANSRVYFQVLSWLAANGFLVVAIDIPGHGDTGSLTANRLELEAYALVIHQAILELGLSRYVLVGHSFGGRLAAEVAALDTSAVLHLVPIDAIFGGPWDDMMASVWTDPKVVVELVIQLGFDTASLLRGPWQQTLTVAKLAWPLILNYLRHPTAKVAPALAIFKADPCADTVAELRLAKVPVTCLHGEKDVIPISVAHDVAAASYRGQVITVTGAPHSWLINDPGAGIAVMRKLREGEFLTDLLRPLKWAGINPLSASDAAIESVYFYPHAKAVELARQAYGGTRTRPLKPPRRYGNLHAVA